MPFQYTKAELKTALQKWNTTSDTDFVFELDNIIQRGELSLARRLDLDLQDGLATTVMTSGLTTFSKPANLVVDRVMRVLIPSPAGTRTLLRRSRAWVEMYNQDYESGVPKYYCDRDENNWRTAPIPNANYTIEVYGWYRPASIVDGADAGTTWLSTRVPDLLFLACSIEATEFLKFWAHKAANEAELEEKVVRYLGVAASMQRSDDEDLLGDRQDQNKPDTQAGT